MLYYRIPILHIHISVQVRTSDVYLSYVTGVIQIGTSHQYARIGRLTGNAEGYASHSL